VSIACMTRVWEHSRHKGSELLVLLAIADFAHDDGSNAFPSIGTLAKKTRLSVRSVQDILRKLERSGELRVDYEAGPGGTNVYQVVASRGENFAPPPAKRRTRGVQPTAPEGVRPAAPNPSSVTVSEPSSVSVSYETGASAAVDKSREKGKTEPIGIGAVLGEITQLRAIDGEADVRELIGEAQRVAWLGAHPPKGDSDRAHQVKLIRELGKDSSRLRAALAGARVELGTEPFGLELLAAKTRSSGRRLLDIFADRFFKNDRRTLPADVIAVIRQALAA
jgi:DNA-binding Lrp family transcriptional regulator